MTKVRCERAPIQLIDVVKIPPRRPNPVHAKKRPTKAAIQKDYLLSTSFLFPPPLPSINSSLQSPNTHLKMASTAPDTEKPSLLPIAVQKPTPYTFDLGLLLASDPNPLFLSTADKLEEELAENARDGAQALLNQLLSTCPIASTPSGVLLSLPGIEMKLPREKVCFPFPSFTSP